jgi:hypothetical protein
MPEHRQEARAWCSVEYGESIEVRLAAVRTIDLPKPLHVRDREQSYLGLLGALTANLDHRPQPSPAFSP